MQIDFSTFKGQLQYYIVLHDLMENTQFLDTDIAHYYLFVTIEWCVL
jgi:hypothetical protein